MRIDALEALWCHPWSDLGACLFITFSDDANPVSGIFVWVETEPRRIIGMLGPFLR